MRRQERLFAIAEFLRARRTGVTAGLLAQRFGVTLRTIYRDLDSLRAADLPLQAEQGRGGGYSLDRHYSLPPINLNAREAALLSAITGYAIRMRLIPFTDTLQAALDKVQAALTVSSQRELAALMKTLEFVGIPAHGAKTSVRSAVEDAWFQQSAVDVEYEDAQGARSKRRVRIEGVLMERTRIMLKCTDLEKSETRHLRLDRIHSARVVTK